MPGIAGGYGFGASSAAPADAVGSQAEDNDEVLDSYAGIARVAIKATEGKAKLDYPRTYDVGPTDTTQSPYLTDVALLWERQLLLRICKCLRRMMESQLTQAEVQLLEIYEAYDENLDGIVAGAEAAALLRDCKQKVSFGKNFADGKEGLLDADGNVTFLNMLRWNDKHSKPSEESYFSSMYHAVVAASGMKSTDQRLAELPTDTLRTKIFGFRRLVEEVRYHHEEVKLLRAQGAEKDKGLFKAAEDYHRLVSDELDPTEQTLFDAFLQVDSSGDLMLQRGELDSLLRRIEPDASPVKIRHRLDGLDLEPGVALSFVKFLQWTYEAEHAGTKGSAGSQAGQQLYKSVYKLTLDAKMDKMITGSWTGDRSWKDAYEKGVHALQELRDAYIRTFRELRCYKMELEFRKVELDCTHL
eukprot:TRINITY_DN46125_c0_g1_i2.p1 TRINITY_DN46125_c0_g1~~TRINITY_DN46125_c0_g1_i2.p1  ORF type:complete len:414 (+),score=105.27 TRINITY_DN46125_c0_g1_i2:89-1330(+)